MPVPPPQARLFREHLQAFGVSSEGLLFCGVRGRPLATVTIRRVWDRARKATLTVGEYNSPLARRAYDLRHACLSPWLNGGVAPAQVAEWAGHSVDMLLRIYARCLDGQHDVAMRRTTQALGENEEPGGARRPARWQLLLIMKNSARIRHS